MNCEICGGKTVIRKGQKYHYVESGLDNVWLLNVETRSCTRCKTTVARIPGIKALHRTIGQAIALKDSPLSGQEIRFLRKRLGLNAREFSRRLKVNFATLSRWENDSVQPGRQADALIRAFYFLSIVQAGESLPPAILERMDSISEKENEEAVSVDINNPAIHSWRPKSEFSQVVA